MKTLILTEGGRKNGFGHITRCCALRDALIAQGISTQLWVHGDTLARRQFSGQVDCFVNWTKLIELEKLTRGTEALVVDSYLAPASFYHEVSRQVRLPVFIDDFMRLAYPRGMVVVGGIGAEKFRYPQRSGGSYVLGIKYALLRREFWNLAPRKIRSSMRDVFISFGGIDRTDFTRRLLGCLVEKFPHLRFHIVTARKYRQSTGPGSDTRVRYYYGLDAAEMRSLIERSDVAISGGGQTTNELAACGVPMIGICFADNQKPNLIGWKQNNVLIYAGHFREPDLLNKVINALGKLNFHRRQRMSRRAQRLVDGKGPRRVAEAIMKGLGKP